MKHGWGVTIIKKLEITSLSCHFDGFLFSSSFSFRLFPFVYLKSSEIQLFSLHVITTSYLIIELSNMYWAPCIFWPVLIGPWDFSLFIWDFQHLVKYLANNTPYEQACPRKILRYTIQTVRYLSFSSVLWIQIIIVQKIP